MAATCPRCGEANTPAARFCASCGNALAPGCPRCGADLPSAARFCPSCGASVGGSEAAEERKVVTILFADVTGSTELGERLDPERLRLVFATYFRAMSEVIEAWGGTVEKFIGDAIMAVFGVPRVREDDASRALRAALEMLERLASLNEEVRTGHGVELAIRIGVNTGEVIAPVDRPANQQIVAGDPVNVAARLEQAAEPGTILVGERTYLVTRDAFRFEAAEPLRVKGKSESVTARRLAGTRPEAGAAPGGAPAFRAPLVGRERELAALVGLFDETLERGAPRLALLFGPAGIGKSRLVVEVVRSVSAGERSPLVLRGRCLPAGRGVTYWALGEVLRAACGIGLDDPAPIAAARLQSAAAEALAPLGLDEPAIEETIFALAATAGIELSRDPSADLEPREVADRIARAWPRFVTGLASREPLVVVLEDLHWAGDEMVEMVDRLVQRTSGPALLIATARPEFAEQRPGFGIGREEVSAISIRPLTETQSDRLVDALLESAELPSDLRESILERSEGNPFFLEEIVRRLVDEGALVRGDAGWRSTVAAAQVVLPDTIHGLLAARIDALPTEEKRVLQEASVVGRIFWGAPVSRAIAADATTPLLSLETKGLVVARPTSTIAGEAEYSFKHALVRDVAYASLPRSRRARAQAEVAAWIEELAGERTSEFIEIIADHLHHAVSGEDADLAWAGDAPERERVRAHAVEALLRAGGAARHRYAIERAVELDTAALGLARTDAERARAFEALGDDHGASFHGEDADAAWTAALELARAANDRPAVARLCLGIARMHVWRAGAFTLPRRERDPERIEGLIDEGLAAAGDDASRTWLLALKGLVRTLWETADRPDPVPTAERLAAATAAHALAQRLGDVTLRVLAADWLSDLQEVAGQTAAAIDTVQAEVGTLGQLPAGSDRATLEFAFGTKLLDLAGDAEAAHELGLRSLEAGRILSAHERMHATHLVISTLDLLGRWPEALPFVDQHLAALEGEPEQLCPFVRGGPIEGAIVLARLGQVERAAEVVSHGRLRPTEPGSTEGVYARYLVEIGDVDGAIALASPIADMPRWRAAQAWLALLEALPLAGGWDELDRLLPRIRQEAVSPLEVALIDRAEARLIAARGRPGDAGDLLRRAIDAFDRLRAPYEAALTREALADLATGDERRSLLAEALATYERLGAAPAAERLRTAMAPASEPSIR